MRWHWRCCASYFDDDGDDDDGHEDDNEDGNGSKADDYNGGDGVMQLFSCRKKGRTYRVRVDKAYWCIAGSVA